MSESTPADAVVPTAVWKTFPAGTTRLLRVRGQSVPYLNQPVYVVMDETGQQVLAEGWEVHVNGPMSFVRKIAWTDKSNCGIQYQGLAPAGLLQTDAEIVCRLSISDEELAAIQESEANYQKTFE